MKTLKYIPILFFLFSLFSCTSSSGFQEKEFLIEGGKWIQDENSIKKKPLKKVMVGQEIYIYCPINTKIFKNEATAKITITIDKRGEKEVFEEIETIVKNERIFQKYKIRDSELFYENKKYIIPKISFKITIDDEVSKKSEDLEIYGFIKHKMNKPNSSFLIYRADGQTIKGKTDKNGFIDLKWLPLGQYSFGIIYEDDERYLIKKPEENENQKEEKKDDKNEQKQ